MKDLPTAQDTSPIIDSSPAPLDHKTSPKVTEFLSYKLNHLLEATELNMKNYEMNQFGCGPSSPVLWWEVVYLSLLGPHLSGPHVRDVGG